MKRLLAILLLSFCINSCDDGEFEIQSFDFSSIPASQCLGANASFFIYYTNDREALFLEIPDSNFPPLVTESDNPRNVTISSTNKVTYRVYNGAVTSASICSAIPPVSPTPVEEWIATSGVIEIRTDANKQTNSTTGQSFITGYTHSIKLVNTLFIKSDGNQQLFEELFLGAYVINVNPPTIDPSSLVRKCGDSFNYIFKNTGNQVIEISTDAVLISNSETTVGNPRTAVIGEQNTAVNYKVFSAVIPQPETFFCTSPLPTVPSLVETWTGEAGNSSAMTGIIEVTTQLVPDPVSGTNVFRHTIFLRKVKFEKSGTDFTFGDLYELGFINTPQ